MNTYFLSLLDESVRKRDSLLCVGLDPVVKGKSGSDAASEIVRLNKRLIDATADYAACFKPNIAFYEVFGPHGLEALMETLSSIPKDIPVILDAKRGDIGNTANAYAEEVFGFFKAHAVTVSPYMGKDSIDPFISYPGKAVFVLARTTNPGAQAIQGLDVYKDGVTLPLYMRIAKEATGWGPNVGLVVAGNDAIALAAIRSIAPDAWFLAPGIGAQGGEVETAIVAGARKDGSGILINVSRAISNAENPAEAARGFCERIRLARNNIATHPAKPQEKNRDVVKGIIDEECFRIGSFVLKSGKRSPFYIDLRRIISRASLLDRVGACYAEEMKGLEYARVAGIPFAGIPIATAVSLRLGVPMIFPRLEKKEHGTGNTIEGAFEKGDKVVLIDDLMTTGKSKFEALDVLDSQGIVVTDLVVLLERGTSGRKELADRGVTLHSCFTVEDFIDECYRSGKIGDKELAEIRAFLAEG
jgi:uridine monophosphate synthetase